MRDLTPIIQLAVRKHYGQFDKGGAPYISHPLAVATMCNTESEKVVAILHDILEDTETTIDELLVVGVMPDEIEAIKLLTKPYDEDYMRYIRRVSKNPLARAVKILDLRHNMDVSRLSKVTEKDMQRMEKYRKALSILEDAE